ncbi:MAG: RecX family transcriptional regulator [Thermoflexales bacterium]|nr:RecX family transcriptional regulator [Thermoflexales bacterium]MDW8351813.1 RecX family transcriptional regulator [Anaerolineae bacterium]
MAGVITALKAQQGKERVNVYLDGEFAFSLALVHAVWLKIGQRLSDDEVAALRAADTVEQVRLRALDFIAYRPRSVWEVQRRLKRAGADDVAIAAVIERLKAAGLLDDDAFSRAWVDSRMRTRPRSKRMIAWELRRRGVSSADIAAALEEVDEDDAAYRAAAQRLPKLQGLAPMERKRKLHAYLARKGFDYETIERAIQQVESSVERDVDR